MLDPGTSTMRSKLARVLVLVATWAAALLVAATLGCGGAQHPGGDDPQVKRIKAETLGTPTPSASSASARAAATGPDANP